MSRRGSAGWASVTLLVLLVNFRVLRLASWRRDRHHRVDRRQLIRSKHSSFCEWMSNRSFFCFKLLHRFSLSNQLLCVRKSKQWLWYQVGHSRLLWFNSHRKWRWSLRSQVRQYRWSYSLVLSKRINPSKSEYQDSFESENCWSEFK